MKPVTHEWLDIDWWAEDVLGLGMRLYRSIGWEMGDPIFWGGEWHVLASRPVDYVILCVYCGLPVERERELWANPICHICLPPPKPLPIVPIHV